MDISIVIPVFEESKKIAADINAASQFLENNNLTGEIIIADDGSKDDSAEVAQTTPAPPAVTLKVVCSEHNRGKGHAIRSGIRQSTGRYVMFADSGCCIPYSKILDGLKLLREHSCDIAHASRKLKQSKIHRNQPLRRRICSALFRQLMIYFMKMPPEITDSQCGFKIYNGDIARSLYGKCITDGFMFDIEIILRAKKQNYRIKEFPIEWTCDRDSRLSLSRSFFSVLRELLAIKHALAKED